MTPQSFSQRLKKIIKESPVGSILPLVTGMLVLIFSTIQITEFFNFSKNTSLPKSKDLPELVVEQANALKQLQQQTDSLFLLVRKHRDQLVDSSLANSKNNKLLSNEYIKVEKSLKDVTSRLSSLEGVLLDNPSKAIQTILIQKDLENVKSTNQAELLSLRQEIERVYDLNKWLIGLLFTMAVGILSLAISNLFKNKKIE